MTRNSQFAGKEFFTPEEAAAYERQRLAAFLAQPKDNIHYEDAIWQTETYAKGVSSLRTSLVVEPATNSPLKTRRRGRGRGARGFQ